jgi:hypothetical protein
MNSESLIERPYDAAKRVSLLQKLFIWSVIIEPLLFFILLPSTTIGLPITLSRVFQAAFLILCVLNFIFERKVILRINPLKTNNFYIICYFLLICISSFVGLMLGNYSIDTLSFNDYSAAAVPANFLGYYLRPVFEGFILIYYFILFIF